MRLQIYTSFLLLFTYVGFAALQDTKNDAAIQRQGSGNTLIVLLGGSEGGFFEAPPLTEDLLAAGFAMKKVAYFNFPEGPRSQSLTDINAIADAIRAEAENYDCIGVLGVSKGAELALVLAAYDNVADATVATVPSHGLSFLYESLSQVNVVMTVEPNEDVKELARLVNFHLRASGRETLSDDAVAALDDALGQAEDPAEYTDMLWSQFTALLAEKDVALLDLKPLDGFWSERALIFVGMATAKRWSGRSFGGYGLLTV